MFITASMLLKNAVNSTPKNDMTKIIDKIHIAGISI
jgi:hypothetical protein